MFDNLAFVYIEDDPLSCQVMEMIMLDGLGIQNLTIFMDSADIVTRLKALPTCPDVIFLDVYIEPYDGFEVLAMLRQDPELRQAQIVALTASVMGEDVERLRATGFDGVIGKPLSVLTFSELLTRIAQGEAVWHIT